MAWRNNGVQPQTPSISSPTPALPSRPQGGHIGSGASMLLNIVHDIGPAYLSVAREFAQLQSQLEREETQRLAIRSESQIRLEELRGHLRHLDEIIAANKDLQAQVSETIKFLRENGDTEGAKILSERLMEFRLQANAQVIQQQHQNVSAGYIQIETKEK